MVTWGGRAPLLGDGGAFVMGKIEREKEKTDFELPRIRGAWLLARVAVLLPKRLCLFLDSRVLDKLPNSNCFLQVVTWIKFGPDSSNQEPIHVLI